MLRNVSKIISIAIVLAMVLGAFAVLTPALSARNAPSAQTTMKFVDPEPMYAGEQYHNHNLDLAAMSQDLGAMIGNSILVPGTIYANGSIARYWVGAYGSWAFNDTNPTGYMLFQKRTETTHCELWVATDLTFPAGDPRNAFTSRITINDSQAQYMADEYENAIYPNMTSFFGLPPGIDGQNSWLNSMDRPFFGTNVSGRLMIMIFNIVDESFWDFNYPSYVAGYFDRSNDAFYDRNIINVDCWDWQNRTTGTSARPWVYESTLAHEYQHLLNAFFNPDQISFLNEGCSMYAEILCGYGLDLSYVQQFFYTPDNSLTEWGDQGGINILADYGAAALFTTWLADHFGPEMIQAMVHSNGTSGISSVNYAFDHIGKTGWDFTKAFSTWRLANLILSDSPGNGLYNYKSVDLSMVAGPKVYNWYPAVDPIVTSGSTYFGPTGSYGGYYTGLRNLGAYGTDYISVQGAGPIAPSVGPSVSSSWSSDLNPFDLKFMFQGQAESSQGWQMTQVPSGVDGLMYSENFDHAGAFPSEWHGTTAGTVYGGGPWSMNLVSGSNYQANVNGFLGSYDPTAYQYQRLYTAYYDLTGVDKAQLSFDLNFLMGTPYDFCRIRFSAVSAADTTFQTYQLWSSDVSGKVTLDVSDLTGWVIQLRFDFITYGGTGASMSIDNLAINDVVSTSGWWSGKGDQVDYSLYNTLDLTGMENAVLTLNTSWDIEPNWDFGFVQVSVDDGQTWTTVANEYTTSEYLTDMTSISDNLPGITGNSGGYVMSSYDLSGWVGQVVKVRLRYMTDEGTNLGGWYVTGATLNSNVIPMDSWASGTPPTMNQWLVTLYFPGCVGTDGIKYLPLVMNVNLADVGVSFLREIGGLVNYQEMIILVSPTSGPSDYGFGMLNGVSLGPA